MAKRTICIQNPAKLSVVHHALRISTESRMADVPLEDIWVVILETHQAQISTSALSSLVDNGIGVMLCGKDHMPNGLLLPIGAHSRHAAIVDDQLAISKPLKKRLWQRIVIAKINNQARALDILGLDSKAVHSFSSRVLSGDTSNMESAAASAYFRKLLPEGTRRSGPYAAALDYGYAVLRAGIGRTAVSGGWLVSRGIHHSNDLNAFNLVDDLIEPFRPAIDLLILTEDLSGVLTPQIRARLSSIFEMLVKVGKETTTVQLAIEIELNTLKSAVKGSDPTLLRLPEIIPLQFVEQE